MDGAVAVGLKFFPQSSRGFPDPESMPESMPESVRESGAVIKRGTKKFFIIPFFFV
jgi:hypothetical protein